MWASESHCSALNENQIGACKETLSVVNPPMDLLGCQACASNNTTGAFTRPYQIGAQGTLGFPHNGCFVIVIDMGCDFNFLLLTHSACPKPRLPSVTQPGPGPHTHHLKFEDKFSCCCGQGRMQQRPVGCTLLYSSAACQTPSWCLALTILISTCHSRVHINKRRIIISLAECSRGHVSALSRSHHLHCCFHLLIFWFRGLGVAVVSVYFNLTKGTDTWCSCTGLRSEEKSIWRFPLRCSMRVELVNLAAGVLSGGWPWWWWLGNSRQGIWEDIQKCCSVFGGRYLYSYFTVLL